MAYHSVIARGAINMAGATGALCSLYQRVVRWCKWKAIKDGVSVSVALQLVPPNMQSESPAMQLPSSSDARMNLPLSLDAQMNSGLDKLRP